MLILQFIGIWLVSFIVYHLNPLNDRSNPSSPNNYYNEDNILIRKKIIKDLRDEGTYEDVFREDLIIDWPMVAPFVNSTVIAAVGTFAPFLINILF